MNLIPREVPYIKPWLEINRQYIDTVTGLINQVHRQNAIPSIREATDRGPAEESMMAHQWGVPVVSYPAKGRREHEPDLDSGEAEAVDISFTDRAQIPATVKIAAHKEPLYKNGAH